MFSTIFLKYFIDRGNFTPLTEQLLRSTKKNTDQREHWDRMRIKISLYGRASFYILRTSVVMCIYIYIVTFIYAFVSLSHTTLAESAQFFMLAKK